MGEVIPLFKWYQSQTNVYALARWLTKLNRFAGPGEVTAFFEKPSRYTDEWVEYQDALRREAK